VSDKDKIAIGVRPINRGRSRINCPQTSPAIAIIAATPFQHTLRFKDSIALGERAGKPFGATQLQLFVAIGEERAADREQAKLCGCYTRNPIGVSFTSADDGKFATYYARWVSQRGEFGNWSSPVSMRIAA